MGRAAIILVMAGAGAVSLTGCGQSEVGSAYGHSTAYGSGESDESAGQSDATDDDYSDETYSDDTYSDDDYDDAPDPVAMPANGSIFWLAPAKNRAVLQQNIRNGAAGRLQITAPAGTDSFYVKLKETSPSSGEVMAVFLSPGRTATVAVPLDGDRATTYELDYASGPDWYGASDTFGEDGSYAMADDSFTFKVGTGWQVELTQQVGGNLGTSDIDPGDF